MTLRRGFTLIEVNLAIFVMAVGVLSICSLYSLGFRENRQSVEDVAAAAFADAYLAPFVAGLSATNMTWDSWIQIGDAPSSAEAEAYGVADAVWPENGWAAYAQSVSRDNVYSYRVISNPRGTADGVASKLRAKLPSAYCAGAPSVDGAYQYGFVVTRRGAVVQLAFRLSRRKESLLSQPVFVSEVHFQGDPFKK